jgi:hypothetical protein
MEQIPMILLHLRNNTVTIPHYIELLDYDGADTIPSANDTMGVIAFYPYVLRTKRPKQGTPMFTKH